jgi:AcrR family transcriptional regulator
MSIRKRLSPEESRTAALEAARSLLIELGPQAVTLKAVAGRIGRTHANLLHHFGSASGLQKALARHLGSTICATIAEAVFAQRAGIGSTREIVDLVFDAFDKEGAGALASWMLLSGNEDALDPIVESVHDLVDRLGPGIENVETMHETTLTLILMALGDALLGGAMAKALDLPRNQARLTAERMLTESIAKAHGMAEPS